jgi:hypothetical protein
MRQLTFLRASLFAILIVTAAAGCSAIDDIRDVSGTVDGAVELLDAIEQDGAWDTITDGLDNLDVEEPGYRATVRAQAGPVDEAGEFGGALAEDVTIDLRADARGAALADLTRGDVRRTFYVEPTDGDPDVYEIIDGQYTCANEGDAPFRDGLGGIFEDYARATTGAQLLSVANEQDEDAAIAGRDATRYELESKVPDALAILERFDNPELQARLDEAGHFALAGDLYLDDETGALLALTSDYTAPTDDERASFRFEITQWGNVPDIPPPAAANIAQPCPG